MKLSTVACFSTLLVLALPAVSYGAKVVSDLQPPQKRQTTVATAERLARRATPPPLASDLKSPFNPPGFGRAEQSTAPIGPVAVDRNVPPPPPGDREILEAVAAQLNPTGMIQFGDAPRLVMGSKRFEVGTRFTVTYNNQDYELELVAIDRTTFTLRYRGEQFTRPIKSVR